MENMEEPDKDKQPEPEHAQNATGDMNQVVSLVFIFDGW